LKEQSNKSFEWFVIDDGSSDETEEVVKELKKNSPFLIEYLKKENGGKHTALNIAFKRVKTELLIILDSDDYLIKNAIDDILNTWDNYKNDKVAGLVFKRGRKDGTSITQDWGIYETTIKNYNQFIINRSILGDKAEVFRTDILKEYQYPEFENEKFVGEGVIWSKIAHNYDMIFCNKIIYICEYLDKGLTRSGRILRINNPLGGMFHSQEYFKNTYTFKIRIKNAILYLTYAKFAKQKFRKLFKINKEKSFLIMAQIPSLILYYIWKKKYKK
jgi:glycosyltransferase involved in cell wall biosynthesis